MLLQWRQNRGVYLLLTLSLMIMLTVVFESFQQLFYIRRYSIGEGITFTDIFSNHLYRWAIWLGLSYFLFRYIKLQVTSKNWTIRRIWAFLAFISGLVMVNVFVIAAVQFIISETHFNLSVYLSEYVTFFFFQKSPLYLLGYFLLAVTGKYYFENHDLKGQVLNFDELRNENDRLSQEIRSAEKFGHEVLSVKIGRQIKIISTSEIKWIEADDYVAHIHMKNGNKYTMRATLKSLEHKLSLGFIRIHRKAIVNLESIRSIRQDRYPEVLLAGDVSVPIAKSKVKDLKAMLSSK